MGSGSGPSRMDSGYSGSQRNHSSTSASQANGRSRSHIIISSDDDPDAPDARLLAELAEVKEGIARVEDRIGVLWWVLLFNASIYYSQDY